jgi:hypothetical protein
MITTSTGRPVALVTGAAAGSAAPSAVPRPGRRPKRFTVRTSVGRLDVVVCGFCAALVLAMNGGQRQPERLHVAAPDPATDPIPTD